MAGKTWERRWENIPGIGKSGTGMELIPLSRGIFPFFPLLFPIFFLIGVSGFWFREPREEKSQHFTKIPNIYPENSPGTEPGDGRRSRDNSRCGDGNFGEFGEKPRPDRPKINPKKIGNSKKKTQKTNSIGNFRKDFGIFPGFF